MKYFTLKSPCTSVGGINKVFRTGDVFSESSVHDAADLVDNDYIIEVEVERDGDGNVLLGVDGKPVIVDEPTGEPTEEYVYDEITVSEIKDILDEKGIEYKKSWDKPELFALLTGE